MNSILSNALPQRKIPDWRAVNLASRVPIKILRAARDYHTNTSDEMIFKMLDSIGIDAIADMVSQGCFIYDVATTLDIPVTKFQDWLSSNHTYISKVEDAERLSAEAYLSKSTDLVMDIQPHDVDGAKVAKLKADHLKWLAKVKDRDKYADRVNLNHSGSQAVEYRITLVDAPEQQHRVIDVPYSE